MASLIESKQFMIWLVSYFPGRLGACLYNHSLSSLRRLPTRVPHSSFIAPYLVNHYVGDYPQSAPFISSYADNFTAATSSSDYRAAFPILADHASNVTDCARNKSLSISLAKSHSTLFTPDTYQSPTLASYPRVNLSQFRDTTRLSVSLVDTHFTFTPHISYIREQCALRFRILNALAGDRCGQDKETLLVTYRALFRSFILYAGIVWHPKAFSSALRRLQRL